MISWRCVHVVIVGLILIIVGWLVPIPLLVTLGLILLIIGVILWFLGTIGHPVGRAHYW
jgi:hypothetical protein